MKKSRTKKADLTNPNDLIKFSAFTALQMMKSQRGLVTGFVDDTIPYYCYAFKGGIFVLSRNCEYTISYADFIEIFRFNDFYLYDEENHDCIDLCKDDEYYAFKHK